VKGCIDATIYVQTRVYTHTNIIWTLCNGEDSENPLEASGNMKDETEIIIYSRQIKKKS